MTYLLWIVVVIFFLISFLSITFVFIIARSFFREAPYVPLDKKSILQSLALLDIKKGDRFIDIGSGDGRVVFHAIKQSNGTAEYTGIEIDPVLVNLSKVLKILVRSANQNGNVKFFRCDANTFNYGGYNKVFIYLTTPLASQVVSILLKQLPKGSTIVSAYFPVTVKDREFEYKGVDIVEKKYEISGKIKSFYIITT